LDFEPRVCYTRREFISRQVTIFFSGLTTTFLKEMLYGVWITAPLLLSLAILVTLLGQIGEEGRVVAI